MKSLALGAGILVLLGLTPLTPGLETVEAYCGDGEPPLSLPYGNTPFDVPVYYVQDAGDFAGVSHATAIHHIKIAVKNWHEYSVSDFRPYYAGTVSSVGFVAGAVYIDDTSNCEKCPDDSAACEKDRVASGWGGWNSLIYFEVPDDDNTTNCVDELDYWTTNAHERLRGTLIHELGHSWAIGDEYGGKCGSPNPDSAMTQSCRFGRTITRRDIGAMNAESPWGIREVDYETMLSFDDGSSWSIVSEPAVTGMFHLGSLGKGPYTSREIIPWITLGLFYPASKTAALVGYTGSSFSLVAPSQSYYSFDPGAAAVKSHTEYAYAYRPYEYEYDGGQAHRGCEKGLVLSSYRNGSWTTREARPTNSSTTTFSANEGVSLTYDPDTDLYIAAIAGRDIAGSSGSSPTRHNRIVLHAWKASDGERAWQRTLPSSYASRSQPSIACVPTQYVSPRNCMLAWQSIDDISVAEYARIDLTSSGWASIDGITSFPTHVELFPTVTANWDYSYPFLMGIQQNVTYYLYRYSTSSSVFSYVGAPIHMPGGVIHPAIGNTVIGSNGSVLYLRYAPL